MTAPEIAPCPRCGIPIEMVPISRCCRRSPDVDREPAHRVREMLVYDGRIVHSVDATKPRGQIVWVRHEDLCDAIVAARAVVAR